MIRSGNRLGGGIVRSLALILLLLPAGAVSATPGVDAAPDLAALTAVREDHDAGRLDQALARLEPLSQGVLADHVAYIRTRLLHERGQIDEAIESGKAALALKPPTELKARLHQELASLYMEKDDVLEAYQSQRRAWETTERSENAASLAMDLARAFEKLNRPGLALQLYRQVWTEWTLSDVSPEAFRRAAKLTEGTGAEPPSPQPLLERAHKMRTAYRCGEALESYDDLLSRPGIAAKDVKSAKRGRADCLFQRRRYLEAADAYREIAQADPKDFDAAVRVARSYARGRQPTKALAEFKRIEKKAGPKTRARCWYLMGVIQRTRVPSDYRKYMRKVEKQSANPGLARLARWRLAWEDLKAGEYKKALPRMASLSRGSIWDIEVQRGLYWRGIANLKGGKAEQGRKELRDLMGRLPLSYYGMMAARTLGERPEVVHSFVGKRDRDADPLPARRARWLLEAGWKDLADLELASWRYGNKLNRHERLLSARILHGLGQHHDALRTIINGFGGSLAEGIDPEWRDAWELAWPRPFEGWVGSAISEFDFDPSLVYSIMREESSYRPKVESSAGAMGLMQIIPPTGKRIAARLGVQDFGPENLYEPATNIRFGTWYLKSLVGQFKGSHPRAIASYNAGPEIVSEWLARDGPLDDDAFVESVPYQETRGYLRRVLRSYAVYEMLYDDNGGLQARTSPQSESPAGR